MTTTFAVAHNNHVETEKEMKMEMKVEMEILPEVHTTIKELIEMYELCVETSSECPANIEELVYEGAWAKLAHLKSLLQTPAWRQVPESRVTLILADIREEIKLGFNNSCTMTNLLTTVAVKASNILHSISTPCGSTPCPAPMPAIASPKPSIKVIEDEEDDGEVEEMVTTVVTTTTRIIKTRPGACAAAITASTSHESKEMQGRRPPYVRENAKVREEEAIHTMEKLECGHLHEILMAYDYLVCDPEASESVTSGHLDTITFAAAVLEQHAAKHMYPTSPLRLAIGHLMEVATDIELQLRHDTPIAVIAENVMRMLGEDMEMLRPRAALLADRVYESQCTEMASKPFVASFTAQGEEVGRFFPGLGEEDGMHVLKESAPMDEKAKFWAMVQLNPHPHPDAETQFHFDQF